MNSNHLRVICLIVTVLAIYGGYMKEHYIDLTSNRVTEIISKQKEDSLEDMLFNKVIADCNIKEIQGKSFSEVSGVYTIEIDIPTYEYIKSDISINDVTNKYLDGTLSKEDLKDNLDNAVNSTLLNSFRKTDKHKSIEYSITVTDSKEKDTVVRSNLLRTISKESGLADIVDKNKSDIQKILNNFEE